MFKIVAHRLQTVVFFALLACTPKPTPAPLPADASTRAPLGPLPRGVVPVLYDLALTLDPALERYHGKVDIALQVHRPTTTLWLHGQDVDVENVTVRSIDGQKLKGTYSQVTPDGVAQIVFEAPLRPGIATLSMEFESTFSTQLNGLYRVFADGQHYIYTQFEALSARRAFPCFDEPAFKTPFELTLNIPESLTAISNTMPMGEQRTNDGTKTLVFKSTAPLPTYLLAIAVGQFDVVETEIPANIQRGQPLALRGVAVRGQGSKLDYAVKHTGDLLQGLEQYFGQAYPFSKLDIIAVPDFAAGAMENAGAVTFRDWLILLDPATVSQSQTRGFAYVVAHELAHQWFGDDVTMPWWNDIWLNESFATWMGYKVANAWDPNLRLDLDFVNGIHGAMGADALAHARKIHQPCETHDDVHNAFDSITYLKGGGVLRMFESFIGPDAFQAGVRQHIGAHHYASADSAAFLQAIEAAGHTPGLAADFTTFLDQPGVPEVQVALDCNQAKPSITLTQSRYKPVGSTIDPNAVWRIPVCWRAATGKADPTRTCVLLTQQSQSVEMATCPTWLMPDADGAGYYHWALPPAQVAELQKAPLSAAEQLSVASNLQAAFAAATLPGDEVLKALAPLTAAKTYNVAVAPLGLFDFVYRELIHDKARPAAAKWFTTLYGARVKALGTQPKSGESGEQAQLRRALIRFFAETLHEPGIRAAMQGLGESFLGYGYDGKLHPRVVSPDLADIALVAAANARGGGFTHMLIEALRHCDDVSLRRQIVSALARISEPESAAQVRGLTLDPVLRLNEIGTLLAGQMREPAVRDAAWSWFKSNFEALRGRLPSEQLGSLPGMVGGFCSGAQRDDAEAFFKDKVASLPGGARSLAQTLESISLCQAQVAAQQDRVSGMFAP